MNFENFQDNDAITVKMFLTACKTEAVLGELFIKYNTTYTSTGIIPHYVYCNKYFYAYDCQTRIWEELESDILNARIERWVRTEYEVIRRDAGVDTDKIFELSKAVDKVLRFKHIDCVLKNLKNTISDIEFFVKLDRVRPNWLPIKGGLVINLQTNETRERRIDDYFSWECPVKPVKQFTDFFLKVISSIMCDNKENLAYFQKMMGYCITGSKEAQSYFIWYGKGSNGKSLILNLLKAVLGKACEPVTKSVLIDAGKKGSNGTEVVSLKDLRLGTFSETNSQDALNESMLKMISGGDKIKARGLYKDEISFELFLKLIVCTNHKPEFNGSDHGTVRRIKFLPFEARFSATPKGINQYPIIDDLENILIKNYLDEFFTFCLWGANAWYNDKLFQDIPEAIAKQQNDYIKEQNTVETWFTERVDENPHKKISRPDCYKDYTKWCEENASSSLSKKDFFTKITEKCGKTYKSHGIVYYKGYELRNENFDTEDDSL